VETTVQTILSLFCNKHIFMFLAIILYACCHLSHFTTELCYSVTYWLHPHNYIQHKKLDQPLITMH